MRTHEEEWASGPGVCAIQSTSGSSGKPLFIYRSVREVEFIDRFFARLDPVSNQPAPLGLSFVIPQHGIPISVPGPMLSIPISIHTDKLLAQALLLMRKRFAMRSLQRSISVLTGDHHSLLLLARYAEEHPSVVEQTAVQVICPTGRQLTSRWREAIETAWNAKVYDRYSMSEIFGGATSCPDCDGYHFDPHVIPEIVPNPQSSGAAIRTGIGHLALTSLAPFVSNQPFIRYLSGDLFRARESRCPEISYDPLGRASQALMSTHLHADERAKLVLAPSELIDVLDSIPDLDRPPAFSDVSLVRKKSDINLPVFRGLVEEREHKRVISIQVSSPDASIHGRFVAVDVTRESPIYPIAQLLATKCRPFASAHTEVEVLPPKSLPPVEKKSILWVDSPQK